MKNVVLFTLLMTIILILEGISVTLRVVESTEESEEAAVVVTEPSKDTLSEWQLFTLALIEVESENDSTAVSVCNARGILQLTEQYIEDVNRLTGWNMDHHDAHNMQKALLCFDVIQTHYNPEYDIEKAIRLHNPKAGQWYQRRVFSKMDEIRQREYIRHQLTATR